MRGWRTLPALKGYRVALMYPKKPSPRLTVSMVREGCTSRPFFTVQVRNNLQRPNDPGLEQIGSWDPLVNTHGEQLVGVNVGRLMHWMGHGARPSRATSMVLGLGGVLPMPPMAALEALRLRQKLMQQGNRDSAAAAAATAASSAGQRGKI